MVEQAVILAGMAPPAGSGQAGAPDRVLLGLGLLQRMVAALAHGGIRRILVLVREDEPRPDGPAAGAASWSRFGAEVRLAAPGEARLPLPASPFLLLGGMVVFDSALAREVRRFSVADDRLLVPDGGEGPAAAFTGLALCRADFFPRLLSAAGGARSGESLAALLAAPPRVLADHGWVRVDSRRGEEQARRLLRRSLGKPSDGFFSRHLNRRLSWPISRLLIRLGASPNLVTLANLALGLFSAWLVGRGGYGNMLAAGLLLQFVSVTDGCDGEIARLTYRFSPLGARLDNLCDTAVLIAFFINLPIGLHAAAPARSRYLVLGALMALLVAVFYLLLLARVRLSGHRGNIAEIAHRVQRKGGSGEELSWLEHLGTRLGFSFRKEFISLYAMAWCLVGHAEGLLWTLVCMVPPGIVYQVDHIRKLRKRRPPARETRREGNGTSRR